MQNTRVVPLAVDSVSVYNPLTRLLAQIIRKAVSSMLPKNTFRQRRLERLKIFAGEENPYAENVVKVFRGETPARDVAERV
jgi:ribosomal protein L13